MIWRKQTNETVGRTESQVAQISQVGVRKRTQTMTQTVPDASLCTNAPRLFA